MKFNQSILCVLLFINSLIYAQEWHLYTRATHQIPDDHINSVFVDDNNIKWFGTDAGLVSYDGDDWYTHSLENKIFSITSYSELLSNMFWITTDVGLFLIKANSASDIQILNEYNIDNSDIISNYCTNCVVDNQGYNWIGSNVGLSIFDGKTWLSFSASDSIFNVQSELISIVPFNKVMDIKHREIGMVNADNGSSYEYIATQGAGINRLKYDDVDGITGASKLDTEWSLLPSDTINTIYFDSQNIAWYGTNYGLSMHSGDNIKRNWETFSTDDGLVNDTVLTIMEDSNLNIWIGTVKGVSRYTYEIWNSWNTKAQSAGDSVFAIAEDQDKSIWLCTNEGILNFLPSETSVDDHGIVNRTQEFDLSVYPNPFNPSTKIYLTLKRESEYQLKVYSIMGQEIETIRKGRLNKGNHTVEWRPENLSSGTYIIYLVAGDQVVSKKCLLIR